MPIVAPSDSSEDRNPLRRNDCRSTARVFFLNFYLFNFQVNCLLLLLVSLRGQKARWRKELRILEDVRKNKALLLTKQFNNTLQAFILFDIQLPNLWFELFPLFLRWLMTLVCWCWDIYERHGDILGSRDTRCLLQNSKERDSGFLYKKPLELKYDQKNGILD
jgi:hypothetical protein